MATKFIKIEYRNAETNELLKLGLRTEYDDGRTPDEHWEYQEDAKGIPIAPTYFKAIQFVQGGGKLETVVRLVTVKTRTPQDMRKFRYEVEVDPIRNDLYSYRLDAELETDPGKKAVYTQKVRDLESQYKAAKDKIRQEIPSQQ